MKDNSINGSGSLTIAWDGFSSKPEQLCVQSLIVCTLIKEINKIIENRRTAGDMTQALQCDINSQSKRY